MESDSVIVYQWKLIDLKMLMNASWKVAINYLLNSYLVFTDILKSVLYLSFD